MGEAAPRWKTVKKRTWEDEGHGAKRVLSKAKGNERSRPMLAEAKSQPSPSP